jgi:hypothetical protein
MVNGENMQLKMGNIFRWYNLIPFPSWMWNLAQFSNTVVLLPLECVTWQQSIRLGMPPVRPILGSLSTFSLHIFLLVKTSWNVRVCGRNVSTWYGLFGMLPVKDRTGALLLMFPSWEEIYILQMGSTKQTNSDSKLSINVSIYSHIGSFSKKSLGFIHWK